MNPYRITIALLVIAIGFMVACSERPRDAIYEQNGFTSDHSHPAHTHPHTHPELDCSDCIKHK